MQGVVTRSDEMRETSELVVDPTLRMVNRNRGSGTRILIDQLLGDSRPGGFAHEPRSHYAVAAAVAQGRADWGVTIQTVANEMGLRFRPLRSESYDFVIPSERRERPAVQAFLRVLEAQREPLAQLGFGPPED
jgi:putative molybdopterin biosynthesis protein